MTKETVLFKEYEGENISDIQRDIHEMFDSRINPNVDTCEKDEQGIHTGKFRVSVIWCSENDCDCTGFEHYQDCQNHWSNNPNPDVSYDIPY